jgi:hypothetical protein
MSVIIFFHYKLFWMMTTERQNALKQINTVTNIYFVMFLFD